MYAKVKKTSSF